MKTRSRKQNDLHQKKGIRRDVQNLSLEKETDRRGKLENPRVKVRDR